MEFNVVDYDESIAFYDAMFGWLGYMSFWTLDIEYRSTYYMARFPLPHSYIGIQPAATGEELHHTDQAVGINHIALWARSRAEVDRFYSEFLVPRKIPVTDPPQEYPVYTPPASAVGARRPSCRPVTCNAGLSGPRSYRRGSAPAVGQDQRMRNIFVRSAIAILAAAPVAAASLFGAGIGSAEPLNCINGQFWDPITNTCQSPRPAENCAPGDYWNPLSNACRPLGQL